MKRTRKQNKKFGQTESSHSTSSPRKKEEKLTLKEKYKNLTGACDWFQLRKIELETQKKSLVGLPIHHQWKTPRIDQEKYQADVSTVKKEKEGDEQTNLHKRKRSYSADLESEINERP